MLTGFELDISRDEDLQPCQLMALCSAREAARAQHELAMPRLRERAARLGFCPGDVDVTLEWIKGQAPIVIPIDLEKIGKSLAQDTHFRNQFETESSDPLEDWQRAQWEEVLFHGAYQDVSPPLRCKCGLLNVTNDTSGVKIGTGTAASSYLLLRNVRHRVTLTSFDTSVLVEDAAHMKSAPLGTLDFYAHVVEEYKDSEFCAALKVGTRRSSACDSSVIESCKEVQIHGDVKLSEHVELVMVNPALRSKSLNTVIEKLAASCKARFIWLEESVPQSLRDCDPGDDANLEMALKASLQLTEDESRFRQKEEEDLAYAIKLSTAPSASDSAPAVSDAPISSHSEDDLLAKAIEVSMLATNAAVAAIPSCSQSSAAPPAGVLSTAACEDTEETEYVLKASLDNDVRRFRLTVPNTADAEEIASTMDAAVQKSFGVSMAEYHLKYEDEDGDLCTLVKATVPDYLSLRNGPALKKVLICPRRSQQVSNSVEVTSEVDDHTLTPEVLSLASGSNDQRACLRQHAAAVKIQSAHRGRCARAAIKAAVQNSGDVETKDLDDASSNNSDNMGTRVEKEDTEATELGPGSAQEPAAEEVVDSPATREFSMVTPPSSPRGQAVVLPASSIEDEYKDEYVSWTFVAAPTEKD